MAVHCCLYSWTDQTEKKKYYHRECQYAKCSETFDYDGHKWALEKDTDAKDCAHCWTARELPVAGKRRATPAVKAKLKRRPVAAKRRG